MLEHVAGALRRTMASLPGSPSGSHRVAGHQAAEADLPEMNFKKAAAALLLAEFAITAPS
jgi:hypothetical protein